MYLIIAWQRCSSAGYGKGSYSNMTGLLAKISSVTFVTSTSGAFRMVFPVTWFFFLVVFFFCFCFSTEPKAKQTKSLQYLFEDFIFYSRILPKHLQYLYRLFTFWVVKFMWLNILHETNKMKSHKLCRNGQIELVLVFCHEDSKTRRLFLL